MGLSRRIRLVTREATALWGRITVPRRPGAVILAYHRVGGGTAQELDLPTESFEYQMGHLSEHHRIVSLDEAIEMGRESTWSEDVFVITFDDGYEDVYLNAFPILQKYKIPAMMYLATDFIERGRALPWTPDGARPLTWSQVGEMIDSGLVSAGSHTHTHPNLGRLSEDEIQGELMASKQLLTDRLGVENVHFSYPMPSRVPGDFCPPAADSLVKRGFLSATIGGYSKNLPPLAIHGLTRVPVQQSDTPGLFRAGLEGYLRPYARLSGLVHGLRGIRERVLRGRNSERGWY